MPNCIAHEASLRVAQNTRRSEHVVRRGISAGVVLADWACRRHNTLGRKLEIIVQMKELFIGIYTETTYICEKL